MIENEKATIQLDSPIITDRHVPCNKPDIVIQEKMSDRCQIIDVAIPSDYNIQKKATEKKSKYIDLQIEFQRIWNKKVDRCNWSSRVVDKNIKKDAGLSPAWHYPLFLVYTFTLREKIFSYIYISECLD